MDTGPIVFLLMGLCSQQNFQGQACSQMGTAYFVSIDGQKALDGANKKYLDPQPDDIKRVASAGLLYYNQKVHVKLNKYITVDTGFERDPSLNETLVSNYVTFHMDFP